MRTIPAQEIKRRGMTAVDELLPDGPVYVIQRNRLRYVVLDTEQYQELLEAQEAATVARVKQALAEAAAGQIERFDTTAALMEAIDRAEPDAS